MFQQLCAYNNCLYCHCIYKFFKDITLGDLSDLWPPSSTVIPSLCPSFIPGEMIQFWVKNLDIWANQLIISDSTWGGPSSPQFPGKRLMVRMVRMVVQRLVKPIATTVEDCDRTEPDPIAQNELTLATSRSAAWRDWGHSMKENISIYGEENGRWRILKPPIFYCPFLPWGQVFCIRPNFPP